MVEQSKHEQPGDKQVGDWEDEPKDEPSWPDDPDTGVAINDSYSFVVKGGCGWSVEIMPGFFWHPSDKLPWFYRVMQRLLLGFKWKRK